MLHRRLKLDPSRAPQPSLQLSLCAPPPPNRAYTQEGGRAQNQSSSLTSAPPKNAPSSHLTVLQTSSCCSTPHFQPLQKTHLFPPEPNPSARSPISRPGARMKTQYTAPRTSPTASPVPRAGEPPVYARACVEKVVGAAAVKRVPARVQAGSSMCKMRNLLKRWTSQRYQACQQEAQGP